MESESPEYTGTRQFFVVHSGYEEDFFGVGASCFGNILDGSEAMMQFGMTDLLVHENTMLHCISLSHYGLGLLDKVSMSKIVCMVTFAIW